MGIRNTAEAVWRFYIDGFRNMTWGKPLWGLIILKLIILFAVLRVFFFEPVLAGKTDEQKSDHVGVQLTERICPAPSPGNTEEADLPNDQQNTIL